MANVIKERYPGVETIVGDVQKRLPFPDKYFDRVIAIHVFEHLPDLPAALKEIKRTLKPEGSLAVVIPCEGGMAYTLARHISAKRIFEKKYKMKYDWLIKTEHINLPDEILNELNKEFVIHKKSFFPIPVPLIFCNLCIGLECKGK